MPYISASIERPCTPLAQTWTIAVVAQSLNSRILIWMYFSCSFPTMSEEALPEPEWISGSIPQSITAGQDFVAGDYVQQSDTLKPFYEKLINDGLTETYEEYKNQRPFAPPGGLVMRTVSVEPKKTLKPKDVIVVGAGMAGLSAAYELQRAGHRVTILEWQNRVGGRVKTIDHSVYSEFESGLYVDSKWIISCCSGVRTSKGGSEALQHTRV
jgi:hypothetical protein